MDVPKDRFAVEIVKIIQEIAESHFVAIDLEFSGVAGRSDRVTPGKPSLQEIYEETRAAALKYQVLQVGLTIVKEDIRKRQYVLRPYNFNISPLPALTERQLKRDWTMNSGAVSFLLKNRFNFSLPLTHGVPYLSRIEEIQARSKLKGDKRNNKPDMELKPDDDALIKHIRTSVDQWLQQPSISRDSFLNIPAEDRGKGVPGALNNYQIRLTHQIIQNEFPNLKTAQGFKNFVQVIDPKHEESITRQEHEDQNIEKILSRAVGFRWLLEAIVGGDITRMPDEYLLAALSHKTTSKSGAPNLKSFAADLNERLRNRKRVLVGHNCFTDLVYLHRLFIGDLPPKVEDFQSSVRELFPGIVDTKTMASSGNGRWGDTSLQSVEISLRDEYTPVIVVPPEFDRYNLNEAQHEAGYDSLTTAKIAVKLSARMEREGTYLEENDKPSSEVSAYFGEHDGYVTAEQSVGSPRSGSDSIHDQDVATETRDNVVASTLNTSNGQEPVPHTPTTPTNKPSSTVVAVKEKRPVDWSDPNEVEKARSVFANANIYDALDDDATHDQREDYDADGDNDAESDLMSFSDGESSNVGRSKSGRKRASTNVDALVRKGELMPRWDGGNGYWKIFGNKLQVNSCKEGVCQL